MSDQEQKKKLVGPWRSIHGAIWFIGLGILALTGKWWPGILFLIALSMILEAILLRFAPDAYEEPQPTIAASPPPPTAVINPPPSSSEPSTSEHRLDLLPTTCPKCGAPIRGREVNWTGAQSADCPYCGGNLPMEREFMAQV